MSALAVRLPADQCRIDAGVFGLEVCGRRQQVHGESLQKTQIRGCRVRDAVRGQRLDRRVLEHPAGAVLDEYAVRNAGELHTHVQLLDWTHLGSFRHDDPAAFLPSLG